MDQETSTLFAVTMVMRISSRETRSGNLLLSGTLLEFRHFSKTERNKVEFADWLADQSSPGGGGTPLYMYGLYRYVRPQRVCFFSCFGHK